MLHLLFPKIGAATPPINPCDLASFANGLPFMACGTWAAVAAAVVGIGTSIYGADQQRKANHQAQDANSTAQDKQNDAAWTAWLLSKGVQPTSPVAYGQFPAAGQSVAANTRLPLWATITPSGHKFRKIAPVTSGATAGDGTGTAAGGGAGSVLGKVAKANAGALLAGGDPLLGAVIGNNSNTVKKILDPFGVFCWVARAAYGEDNPRWMAFRDWLLGERAPAELRIAYALHGPALAERVKRDATLRSNVREIMDGILAEAA